MNYPIPLLENSFLIDNSSTETFTTCPRSAGFLVAKRRKPAADRVALEFGKIMHFALEPRYQSGLPSLPQTPEVQQQMLDNLNLGFQSWQPPEDDFRNLDYGVHTILKYGEDIPLEGFEVIKDAQGKPFVERAFALPLGRLEIDSEMLIQPMKMGPDGHTITDGPPIVRHVPYIDVIWTGKIDLAYEREERVYIMDHKTTTQMGPTYFSEFELSNQFFGYKWAAEKLLNRPVWGYVINALALRRITRTGKGVTFERRPFNCEKWKTDEWVENTMYIVSDFIEMLRRQVLPAHFKWCQGKYGACPYKQVCLLPPDQREFMINSELYTDATWSPLQNDNPQSNEGSNQTLTSGVSQTDPQESPTQGT